MLTSCEEYAESRLYDRDGSRGAEFSLKYNFRWYEQHSEEDDDSPDDGFVDALREEAADVWQE